MTYAEEHRAELAEKGREAVRLRRDEKLTYQQIARRLSWNPNSIGRVLRPLGLGEGYLDRGKR